MESLDQISQELLETIERYLNHTMGDTERITFMAKLESDTTLQQQVKDVALILNGIETTVLEEKMDQFHKEIAPSTPEKKVISMGQKRRKFIAYGIAASVILALGLFWVFNQKNTSQKLFAEHFSPDPGLPTTMSSTTNFAFYDAMVDYKREEYEKAIEKWQTQLPLKPKNDTLNYFIGVSYLAQGNEYEAIRHLNLASQVPGSAFYEDIFYYLGLGHLKAGKPEAATVNFKLSNREEAKEILLELDH